MKVRMKVEMSGTLNGRPWPPRGGEIDLADDIAAKLGASGHAVPVPTRKTEQATPDTTEVETRGGDGQAGDDTTGDGVSAESGDDETAALHAEAEALGVKVHGNAKPETIRRRIAEARAEAADKG